MLREGFALVEVHVHTGADRPIVGTYEGGVADIEDSLIDELGDGVVRIAGVNGVSRILIPTEAIDRIYVMDHG